jgi:hypothetical protein
MNLQNRILLELANKLICKNVKFNNIHKGECCYIIGNGASLKYFDLSKLNDKVSIGCGALFAHNDFDMLDVKYYYVSHPSFFYKYWKNPYQKKYVTNLAGVFYRKKIKEYPKVEYFTSLSNYFGLKGGNVHYVHHFGLVNDQKLGYEIDKIFTMMSGALVGMIGLALYLGFEDITLIACDYTSYPQIIGHFYEYGRYSDEYKGSIFYSDILSSLQKKIKIRSLVIDDSYEGQIIPSVTYSNIMNEKPCYNENDMLVSKEDLAELDTLGLKYRIYS